MLRMTVAVATIVPGLKLPVPRRAAPIATIANCSAIAGMNQVRYSSARRAVCGSAPSADAYEPRRSIETARKITPTRTDSACDWLNTSSARA